MNLMEIGASAGLLCILIFLVKNEIKLSRLPFTRGPTLTKLRSNREFLFLGLLIVIFINIVVFGFESFYL